MVLIFPVDLHKSDVISHFLKTAVYHAVPGFFIGRNDIRLDPVKLIVPEHKSTSGFKRLAQILMDERILKMYRAFLR